jgi:hypothetical protein
MPLGPLGEVAPEIPIFPVIGLIRSSQTLPTGVTRKIRRKNDYKFADRAE